MIRTLVFCEAPTDFETVSELVERVLQEEGPTWLRELLEDAPFWARELHDWVPAGEGQAFFDLHKLTEFARNLGVRVPQGHFGGQPGEAGALMARTAFLVVRELARRGTAVDAVLLVWDMDDQGQARRRGLDQARKEALRIDPRVIILGCPDPMREAWVLAGFDPETDSEKARLMELRQELGFSPCHEAHRLSAKKEQARRSPKRVLRVLTEGEHEREARCWRVTPLETLRTRGKGSGLAAFLDDVASELIPLFSRTPGPSSSPPT
jgi:hypothetical protein